MEPPVLEGLSPLWARNSCMHCTFAACAAVCPVEAITKYEEGPVVINQDVLHRLRILHSRLSLGSDY